MDMTVIAAIGALCSVVLAGGGIFGFWSHLAARLTANKLNADSAMTAATNANLRIDALITEFSNQREATARNIGKLEATNNSLANAIRDMTVQFRHVVERLDRVVERLPSSSKHES